MKIRNLLPLTFLAITGPTYADLPPLEVSAVVPAPVSKVWWALTSSDGMKAWAVSQADLPLKVGAIWRTKYGKEGALGDEGTIFNELLSYDPERMYSIRIQKPPKGFPFMSSYRDMITVVYLKPITKDQTEVTLRAHGFKDDEESKKLRSFFEAGDRYTLDELVKFFKDKR
jgi:uncharacterized protein YndB with AHSA1/START domain